MKKFNPFKKLKSYLERWNEKIRTFPEILAFSQNSESLVQQLNLSEVKAKKTKEKLEGETTNFFNTVGSTYLYFIKVMKDPRIKEIIEREKEYKKYPLVDLGSNGETSIVAIAQKMGMEGVVLSDLVQHLDKEALNETSILPNAIETQTFMMLFNKIMTPEIEYKIKENYPILDLDIDMLELMEQLPDHSANVSLFSIDSDIISDLEYRKKLFKEILRVVPEGGLLLTNNSFVTQDEPFASTLKLFFNPLNSKFHIESNIWKRNNRDITDALEEIQKR